jgi:dihydroxyacid dehydratase/phosphogluconate dehydratase
MKLRSTKWFGSKDRDGFIHRSWMKNQGRPDHLFDGRPVIGICNTWSELTPCNTHFRQIADHVKRGVYEAGGFPLEFPVMSLGETLMRPTAMLFRNLVSMDVEESIRANPIDGVILLAWLRQDHAGSFDGRGELRHTRNHDLRRTDVEWKVSGSRHWLWNRCVAIQ